MKIVYEMDNDCVGCPQGCIHCGRGDFRYAVSMVCDECGEEVEEIFDNEDYGRLCENCLKACYKKITLDYINDNEREFEDDQWISWKSFKQLNEQKND